ncbi:hypothetical protein C8Q70DRAFT_154997 [Cubamyces menziesii]|nr:hypothetical protein C8Q70DRAFT_154997 [Cubamyces menziesii]
MIDIWRISPRLLRCPLFTAPRAIVSCAAILNHLAADRCTSARRSRTAPSLASMRLLAPASFGSVRRSLRTPNPARSRQPKRTPAALGRPGQCHFARPRLPRAFSHFLAVSPPPHALLIHYPTPPLRSSDGPTRPFSLVAHLCIVHPRTVNSLDDQSHADNLQRDVDCISPECSNHIPRG